MKILGVDIGTSSLKVLVVGPEGPIASVAVPYAGDKAAGSWCDAFSSGLRQLRRTQGALRFSAVGLTGQANTLVLYDGRGGVPVLGVFGWGEPGGETELAGILSEHEPAYYRNHLAMVHTVRSSNERNDSGQPARRPGLHWPVPSCGDSGP